MKKLSYDFENYDRFTAEINKAKVKEIIEIYRAFGFVVVEQKNHRSYEDLVYLTFERRHDIKNKDELQYMQVEVDNHLNKMAKYEHKKNDRAYLFAICFGLLGFCILGMGAWLIFNFVALDSHILALCSLFLGLAICILNIFAYKSILIADTKKYTKLYNDLEKRVKDIYFYAQKINGETNENS